VRQILGRRGLVPATQFPRLYGQAPVIHRGAPSLLWVSQLQGRNAHGYFHPVLYRHPAALLSQDGTADGLDPGCEPGLLALGHALAGVVEDPSGRVGA
jgi:hypothetical protein